MNGSQRVTTFPPNPGTAQERRPRCEALIARAGCFLLLCVVAHVVLAIPPSALAVSVVVGTRVGLLLAVAYNVARCILFWRLRYTLGRAGLGIHLGIQNLRISYTSIATVDRRSAPWPIKKASLFTYAKEVPQLIEYVAQIGAFIVEGRGKIYLYSTLSSYHDPKGLILITTTDGKTYGISPAEPERFLEELEKRRRQARPQ
jgi:hypothetical protein